MVKIKLITILLLLFCLVDVSFTDINSDLNNRKQELNKLYTNLSNKKAEQAKLLKEEKKVKLELNKIAKSIKNNEKELSYIKAKLIKTEKELKTASDKYHACDFKKQEYTQKFNNQYYDYIKRKMISCLNNYPGELKIRQISLEECFNEYNIAQNKCVTAKSDIDKYTKAKRKYEKLKKQQQTLINKNIQLQNDKQELLKTTAGKRVKAEQDIQELKSSENALKALVDKLIKASKQKDKKKSLRASNTNTRKNSLPWPVEGQVILNFGKNKHPTLNTNLISNGIKIKAANGAQIKAIENGVVVFAGDFRKYGHMVVIDHKGIFYSVYCQLDTIFVKENQKVLKKQNIATVGNDEKSVLYFEIRQYNVPENPLLWLKEKK